MVGIWRKGRFWSGSMLRRPASVSDNASAELRELTLAALHVQMFHIPAVTNPKGSAEVEDLVGQYGHQTGDKTTHERLEWMRSGGKMALVLLPFL